jgi:redox-sensitive bicupin YhaK (pirin superfamily)
MSGPTRRDALKWIGAGSLAACTSSGRARDPRESAVIGVQPLSGQRWPTPDPFLFCVHHDDHYPSGNELLGPSASLAGHQMGQDFEGVDGWRMYHGDKVPGFPQHPHRGFETVTIVRRGLLDHSDSMGATARYGRGDVQWLTAGGGIQHAEMFPLIERASPNPVELFQLWLNLPAADKLVSPHFSMLWDNKIPRHVARDDAGRTTEITIVAGRLGSKVAAAPPPKSWAARPDSDVAIWTIKLAPGATWTMPAAKPGTTRWLYFFAGASLGIDDRSIPPLHVVELRAELPASLVNGNSETELLVLQGRPIGEPVVSYGPFVMNSKEEIRATIADFQRTQFGGWPWPSNEPVHVREEGRFAKRPDGSIERPTT